MATPSTAPPSANNPPARPTTPLRPPSRTSLRASQTTPSTSHVSTANPLTALEPAFAELSDSMADLEANFMHLQLLNESIGRFNECFGAFLYGLNMSAFCVDFPEAPIPASFARAPPTPNPSHFRDNRTKNLDGTAAAGAEIDAMFLTTDTSFVENPPTSSKANSRYSSVPGSVLSSRGGGMAGRGRGSERGARGVRGGVARGRGTGRGSAR
nr:hypothetical protein B0A51_13858 [Rachicladosporium sp. CCFEE 5018]